MDALNAQAEARVLIKEAILEAEATLTQRHDSSRPTIAGEEAPDVKLRTLDFVDSTSPLAPAPEATPAKLREPNLKLESSALSKLSLLHPANDVAAPRASRDSPQP